MNRLASRLLLDLSISYCLLEDSGMQVIMSLRSATSQVAVAQIQKDRWIVANSHGAWQLRRQPSTDKGGLDLSTGEDDGLAIVQHLLDGAIAAARSAAAKNGTTNISVPPLSKLRWLWRLSGLYHLTHSTPRLMREAAFRLREQGHSLLAEWADQKATEEQGHDQLAMCDIRSLDYNSTQIIARLQPPVAIALVDYFTRCVRSSSPVSCVGYAYTMERLAMEVDRAYLTAVERHLPEGVCATRCLRVHSGIGSDRAHVAETIDCVAKLTAREYSQIVKACYQTALLSFTPPTDGYLSDADIQALLDKGCQ